MNFIKYSATGNDFIVIDNRYSVFNESDQKRVQTLCERRLGVGADGILLLNPPKANEDFHMVILNADGSRPSMCGNGTRAILDFAHHVLKLKEEPQYSFSTDNGLYQGELIGDEVKVQMTEAYDQRLPESNLYSQAKTLFFINTGVPHLVLELSHIQDQNLEQLAPPLRSDQQFQEGTNVDIFEIIDSKTQQVSMRTFERGVEGETLACGTGVMAVALALKHHYQWQGEIQCETKGGMLKAILEDQAMYFQGPVQAIYQGQLSEREA
jgi:diaminopimelate epimerase